MQYLDLKNKLNDFLVFSIRDIEKIDSSFYKQRLSEWQKKGYVRKVRQGFYIFSDIKMSERVLFIIANRIYGPSYISLEMALSIYGLIPEAVYGITSVTSQRTKGLQTAVGNFIYRHMRPSLFFGYQLSEYNGHYYRIAEIEKAVLDYFYFHTQMNDEESFQGLRFNISEFKDRVDMEKFNTYLATFENKELTRRVNNFLKYIHA